MKFIFGIIIFTCLSLPVFSQRPIQVDNTQRNQNFGDSIETVLTRSNNNLRAFDHLIDAGRDSITFSELRRRYESLSTALFESELHLHFLIRSNSRIADIRGERDNYQRLINELETLQNDFETYLRTAH